MDPVEWVAVTDDGSGNDVCLLLVTGIDEGTLGSGVALFGDSFLRNYYVIHDAE